MSSVGRTHMLIEKNNLEIDFLCKSVTFTKL